VSTGTVAEYWEELLTVGLLGTDRRELPSPPEGALADLAADEPRPSPSSRLLQQVAACTAARRAGVLPGPSATVIDPPPPDHRPVTPPEATATWRRIVADWPVLEDEWLLTVTANGWRVSAELIAPLLGRHRTDGVRRARALVAAGPLAQWVADHQPALQGGNGARPDPDAVAALPDLPISPDLLPLVLAPPAESAKVLGARADGEDFARSDLGVLVNLVARMRADALPAVAARLEACVAHSASIGLAHTVADLARLRHRMLTELERR
jgi:hypothetical protein